MKILYGVSGFGYGHSSRATVVADFLESLGHEVKILTYGDAYKVLRKRFDVEKVSGMVLVFNRGILSKGQTFLHNYKRFAKNIFNIRKFRKIMWGFRPDVCITDFEPIVPLLSYIYRVPLISIDNQHRITGSNLEVPKKYVSDYLLSKAVVNAFVPFASHFIVTSFSNFSSKKKNTSFVSPILREEVKKLKPKQGNKILVYLSKKNNSALRVLRTLNESFVVYGYNRKKIIGNLEFKTSESFSKDLQDCKAIIASSGFGLISEAIYLKKPYYAIPFGGHFEQVLNALFLKDSRFGDYSEEIDGGKINSFLGNLEIYRKNMGKYKFDFDKLFVVIKKELSKIEKGTKSKYRLPKILGLNFNSRV